MSASPRDDATAPTRWRDAVLTLLAGLALPLTLAPFDHWWLGPPLVALWFVLLCRNSSVAAGFRSGLLFGLGKFGFGVSWVYVSIHVYGHAATPLAASLVLLFVLTLALFNGAMGALFCWRFNVGGLRAQFAFVGLWLTLDWVFTWVFTGFPWLLLGYGHLDSPLAGYAPLLGVHGVTLVVVGSGVLIARLVSRGRHWSEAILLTLLWLGGLAASELDFVHASGARSVALVQGNIDQDSKWNPAFVAHSLNTYTALSEPHLDADLIVWPEAAVTLLLEQAGPFLAELGARTAARGGALVTGIVSWQAATGIRNLTVVVGRGSGTYAKRRLVPFGEYVPLEGLLRGLIAFFDLPMSHTEPGAAQQPLLHAGPAHIAMAICYEIVYPDLVRRQAQGANLLATVSNDTWFGSSIGPAQHMQMARMRALELGRWLVRATNNGVTAIVDERGRTQALLPQFTSGVLRGQVQLHDGTTPYAQFGDWPVRGVMLLLLLPALSRGLSANFLRKS